MSVSPPAADSAAACRVVVIDEVRGVRSEAWSLQGVEDALQNHGDVLAAQVFCDWYHVNPDAADEEPLAVSIQHNSETIVIRWCVTHDPEPARIAMRDILAGEWSPW